MCAIRSTASRSSVYLPLFERRGDDSELLLLWKGDVERFGRRGVGASMSRDDGVKMAGKKKSTPRWWCVRRLGEWNVGVA